MAIQVLHKPAYFIDRFDAGRRLSQKLKRYVRENPLVLGIPRGGVEVGYEIAKTLGLHLNVLVSRKIGAPYNEEFGIGAISESEQYINREAVDNLGISDQELIPMIQHGKQEVRRLVKLYGNGQKMDLRNNTVIVVDDGIATGATVYAAILSIRKFQPAKIILAAPVVVQESLNQLAPLVDDVVFLHNERTFISVGAFYKNFSPVTDKTVLKLLSFFVPN